MAELRWLLLLIGIGVIAVVYIYTRYKSGISERVRAKSIRKEPGFSGSAADAEALPLDVSPEESPEGAPEGAKSESNPAESPPSVSPQPRQVVAIRLMSRDRAGFNAERLILLLRELGLRHGQFGIFHRMDEPDGNTAIFSVASLVEPGSFDLTKIKTEKYPGVSIFLTLPGPRDGVSAFDDMLDVARKLAQKLNGNLLDEQGGTLSIQRERYLREEIIQFEHRDSA